MEDCLLEGDQPSIMQQLTTCTTAIKQNRISLHSYLVELRMSLPRFSIVILLVLCFFTSSSHQDDFTSWYRFEEQLQPNIERWIKYYEPIVNETRSDPTISDDCKIGVDQFIQGLRDQKLEYFLSEYWGRETRCLAIYEELENSVF